MRIFVLTTLLICFKLAVAQSDSTALLKEAEYKLADKSASVSSILSDKKYVTIHPQTPFRELIKKYSTTDALNIVTADEPGNKIKVTGTVKNKAGKPIAGALIYLYQTDARGWYAADAPHVSAYEGDMRHARLFGYVKTNNKGQFELQTVKPSGYPKSDLPAHIHIHLSADGYGSYVTELLFDDDERLVGNIRSNAQRNRFIIAKPEKANPPFQQQFSYAITLEED